MRYTLVQTAMWSAFVLDIVDGHGRKMGEIRSPTVFQYKNARLQWHPPGSTAGNVGFAFDGVDYQACVELLRRSRHPEVRYTLERQGEILASVDVIPMPWRRFPDVRVLLPIQAGCEPQGRMWNRRYALRSAHRPVATVFHPHRFTLRTQLAVDIAPGEPVLPLVFAAYVIKEILY